MNDLALPDGSFDVIWCEGAIVIVIGSFAKGLSTWRRLLVPGGHMVVSELCWLRDDLPTEVKAFFEAEGADVTDMDATLDVEPRGVTNAEQRPAGWAVELVRVRSRSSLVAG